MLCRVIWGRDEYLSHSSLGSGCSSHVGGVCQTMAEWVINENKEVRASTIDFSFESLAAEVQEARTGADVSKFTGLVGEFELVSYDNFCFLRGEEGEVFRHGWAEWRSKTGTLKVRWGNEENQGQASLWTQVNEESHKGITTENLKC